MDYRIKFEYKSGALQKAGAVRQKVIQAQKDAAKKAGVSGKSDSQLISSIKTLGSTIQKLIASNKSLENIIKSGGIGGATGGTGGGGAGRTGFLGRMMRGGVSASKIPIIAAVGFAIQKIVQVGNAFIERTSQQARTVGMAGFRKGQGMYLSEEMARGMKEYAIKRGRFVTEKEKAPTGVMGIAGFLGMEAPEALGQAGIYKRAGLDYVRTARQAAGMGIESELPTLLSGIAAELEEAVKNGINTSDMSKDIGKEVAALTTRTAGKSVDAALNIIRTFKGTKAAVAAGKIPGIQELYATRATGQILMERMGRAGYVEKLAERGIISRTQQEKILQAKPRTYEELQEAIGAAPAQFLRMLTAQETADPILQKKSMQLQQAEWGVGTEAFQRYAVAMRQMEPGFNLSQRFAAWQAAKEKAPAGVEARGAAILKKGMTQTELSKAAMGVTRAREREELIFKHGETFAETSLKMEKAMMAIADIVAPKAAAAIEEMAKRAEGAAKGLKKVDEVVGDFLATVVSWVSPGRGGIGGMPNEGNYTDK